MIDLRAMALVICCTGASLHPMPSTGFASSDSEWKAQENLPGLGLAGIWTGSLLQRDWSLEFKNQGGSWSGAYKVPGGKTWHPVSNLVVKGSAISFVIPSKPQISFALNFENRTSGLEGTATIDGLATVPFSATRAP